MRTSSQNGGLVRTLIQMGRKEGPGAYFKGIGPTLLGSIPYEGIKFLCFDLYYDAFRKNIKSGNESTDGILAKLISGKMSMLFNGSAQDLKTPYRRSSWGHRWFRRLSQ